MAQPFEGVNPKQLEEMLMQEINRRMGKSTAGTPPVSNVPPKRTWIEPPPEVPEVPKTGILGRAKDLGISGLRGVVGIPQAAVGLADIVSGGQAGKALEGAGVNFEDMKKNISDYYEYSPEHLQAQRELAETKDFLPSLGKIVSTPSLLANTVVESLPSMVAGGMGGGLAAKAIPALGKFAGAIGEGTLMAGQAAEAIRNETPNRDLSAGQSLAALGTGLMGGAVGQVGKVIGNKAGLLDVDTMLTGAGREVAENAPKLGRVARTGLGSLVEGGEELAQTIGETGLQNVALGKPVGEGMAENAAMGMLAGNLMGAGGGLLTKTPKTPPPVITDDKSSVDVVNGGASVDEQIKSAMTPSVNTFAGAPSGAQGNLFNDSFTSNSPLPSLETPTNLTRMQQTGPAAPSSDPYSQVLWDKAGRDLQTPEKQVGLTEFSQEEASTKEPIINSTLDRVFHQAMLGEIQAGGSKVAKTKIDMSNPAAVQKSVESLYKKYKAISQAQLHPVEGLSTEETHNKAVENKAKAHYIVTTMESSPEFNQYPVIAKNIQDEVDSKDISLPTTDGKETNKAGYLTNSEGAKQASVGETPKIPGLFPEEESTPTVVEKPEPVKAIKTTLAKQEVDATPTPYDKAGKEKVVTVDVDKNKLSQHMYGKDYTKLKPVQSSEVDLMHQDVVKSGVSIDDHITTEKQNIAKINKEEVASEVDEISPKKEDNGSEKKVDKKSAFDSMRQKKKIPPTDNEFKPAVRTSDSKGYISEKQQVELTKLVDKLTGNQGSVEFREGALVRTDKSGKKVTLDGETIGTFVRIATDAKNPEGIARHESIHVLRHMKVISDPEWNVLKAKANGWIKKYNVREDYPNLKGEELVEEAVARAFENGVEKSSVFGKIREFFEKVFNMFRGNKFQSVRQVISRIESGEVGLRPFSLEITDSISKPAKSREEFLDQINMVLSGMISPKKAKKIKARPQFLYQAKKALEGLSEPLNESVRSMKENGNIILHSDIEGNPDEFIRQFEQENSSLMQESLLDYYEAGVLKPLHNVLRSTDPKKREAAQVGKALAKPRVFNAFDAYENVLKNLVEAHSEESADTPISLYNKFTMVNPIETLGELRDFYFKYMRTHSKIKQGFINRNFIQFTDGLAELENMGFAPYKDKKSVAKFFDRGAAIKMYVFYHYGTVSEVLFPEWFVFADDTIRYNLESYKEVFEKNADMFYGTSTASSGIDKLPIKDLVKKSQLITDLTNTMKGKDDNQYIMKDYSEVDRNFVANQVARLMQAFGLVSFEDKYGDAISKQQEHKRHGKSFKSGFTNTQIVDEVFPNIDTTLDLGELTEQVASIDDIDEVGEESDTTVDVSKDREDVGRDLDDTFYEDLADEFTDTSDETPTNKARKDNTKINDPDALRAIVGSQPTSSTYTLAHKDDFKVSAKPNAIEIILKRKSQIREWVAEFGLDRDFKAYVDRYERTNNREEFIDNFTLMLTRVIANYMGITEDSNVNTAVVAAIEKTPDRTIRKEYNEEDEEINQPKIDFSDDPFISMIQKKDAYRTVAGDKAPVPYAFALNRMSEMLYSERSKQGGATKEDAKGNALQKLAQIALVHVAEFNTFPFNTSTDTAVKTIMKHIVANKDVEDQGIGYIAPEVSVSSKKRLESILIRELGYTDTDTRQAVFEQIKKNVAENKKVKKEAASVKMVPKKLVADKLTKLIGNLLLKDQTYYDNKRTLTTLKGDGTDFVSGSEESALRAYLMQLENGLLYASIQNEEGSSGKVDYGGDALYTMKSYIHSALDKTITKEEVDSIFGLVNSIAGDIPLISEASYTPAPTIDLGAIFINYTNLSKSEKKIIDQNWMPIINNLISEIIDIPVSTKIVSDGKGNTLLQIFADDLGRKLDKGEITKAKEDLYKNIWEDENISFTHIRQATKYGVEVIAKVTKKEIEGFDTSVKTTVQEKGSSERRAEVPRAEAGPEVPYVSIKANASHSGPITFNAGRERISKFMEDSLNKRLTEIFERLDAPKEYGVTFANGFADFFGVVVNNDPLPVYLRDVRNITEANLKNQLKEEAAKPTWEVELGLQGIEPIELPIDSYKEIIQNMYKDLNQFMYGENEITRAGKDLPVGSGPVQNIWENKTTGEKVIAEISLTGKAGDHMIRYYNAEGPKKHVMAMSVSKFKERFEQLEFEEEDLNMNPSEDDVLTPYATMRYMQEFETALRDIPEEIAEKIRYVFFEDDALAKRVKDAKEELDSVTTDLAPYIKDGSITIPITKLASANNIQSFTPETIVREMIKLDRGIEGVIREGKAKTEQKMLSVKYSYPDYMKAAKKALDNLMDAGLLNTSLAEKSEKMKHGGGGLSKEGTNINIHKESTSVTKGRKYIMTRKMMNLVVSEYVRNQEEEALETKAAVRAEFLEQYLTPEGTFQNTLKDVTRLLPAKAGKVWDVIKDSVIRVFGVPYYLARRVREFMPLMITSTRRNEMNDKHKAAINVLQSNRENDPIKPSVQAKWLELGKTNRAEYDKLSQLFDMAQAYGEDFNEKKARAEIGYSDEAFSIFKEAHEVIERNMPTRLAKGGADAYFAKFQGIFKDNTLADLAYDTIGIYGGSLTPAEARNLAKEAIPKHIAEHKKWGPKFVSHMVGYNDWLKSTRARIAEVKYWMPRVRRIQPFFVRAFEKQPGEAGKGRQIAFKYFDTAEEADVYLKQIQAKDPSIFKYNNIPTGEIDAKVDSTEATSLALFSTMDSRTEFTEMQNGMDGDDMKHLQSPWFGNATLESGKSGGGNLMRRSDKLIVGYDTDDALSNFTTAFDRIAMSFSRLEYGLTQFGNIEAIREVAKTKPEIQRYIPQFVEHLKHDLQRVSKWEHKTQEYKNFMALYFMGFRWVSSLVNATQPFISGVPELAKVYTEMKGGSFSKNSINAAKDLAKWIKIAGNDAVANYLKPIYNDKNEQIGGDRTWMGKATYKALAATFGEFDEKAERMPEVHKRALEQFSRTGLMRGMFNDISYANDLDDAFLQRNGNHKFGLKNITDNALKWFQITEIINREGSFLTAFDHYYTSTGNFDESLAKAEEFVNNSQYLINKFNMPLAFKQFGPLGTAMYGLMSFPFNMLNQLMHHTIGGVSGDINSAKAILTMLGIIMLLGGAGALPFKDLVEFMYKHFSPNWKGFSGDLDTDVKRGLNSIDTPDFIQNLFLEGVPSVAGITISGNLGMKTPLIGGWLGGNKNAVESVSGASGALLSRLSSGVAQSWRGEYWKAFENLTPEVVASISRSARMYSEGQETKSGRPVYYKGKPVKEKAGEAVLSGLGLKPMSWSEKQGARQSQRDVKTLWEDRRKLALASGEPSEIRRFNEKLLKAKVIPLVKPINGMPKSKPAKNSTQYEVLEENKTF